MHILRWLFLHPVIFAWVLAILAILLNYGVGGDSKEDTHQQAESGEMTEQHADAASDEAHSEGEATSEVETEAKQDTAATEEQAAPAEEKAVEAAAEQAAPAETKVAEATEAAEQTAETVEDDGKAATTAAVAAVATAATAVASGEAAAEQAEPAQTAASADETTQAPSEVTEAAATQADATVTQEAPAETSNDDLLAAAREAYWSNDFERAAEFYQALLARDDQPGYKGELANVYWKQGNSQGAVQLYSDIAVWLKDQGRMAELQNIKVYVDLVDPAVGEKIGELLK